MAVPSKPQPVDRRLVSRSAVEPGKKYTEYRQTLRKDFFYSCAYCAITEFEAQSIRMTIDHYEPRNARRDLENEYNNLMYACGVCNERKGDRYPSPEVREKGHRFFRPDADVRADHFELEELQLKSKSEVGAFTVNMLDLNREALLKLRDIRERMTKCLPLIAEGVLALRSFPIDHLPPYIRSRAVKTITKIADMAASMDTEVDEVLLSFAKSDLIDPDESSDERSAAREEYIKDLKALYPGKSFRAPRGRKRQ
jgi:5-methylcytosine-specific restriction endonuclease McrA